MKSVFTEKKFTDLYRKMTRESEFAVVIWIRFYFMVEIDETLAIMKYSPKLTFKICLLYNYLNFSKHFQNFVNNILNTFTSNPVEILIVRRMY